MSQNVGRAIDVIGLALLVLVVLRYGQQSARLLATGISGTASGTATVVRAFAQ